MTVDANGRTHRQAGATGAGQFATEQRTESPVSLDALAGLPSEHDSARVLATHLSHWASEELALADAVQRIDEACKAAGPDVPRQWVAQVLAWDASATGGRTSSTIGTWVASSPEAGQVLRDAYAAGMPSDWAQEMAERGEPWARGCVKRYAGGLTAEELARLDDAGLAGTPGKAMAYVGCDTDEVLRWHAAAGDDDAFSDYLTRYLSNPGIGRYVREGVPLSDVRLCFTLDAEPGLALRGLVRPDGTTERGPAAIRELVEYAKACGQSTDDAYDGIRAGVPAATVKAFGPKITIDEIEEFEAAAVDPKVARSLRARDSSISPQEAKMLQDAGVLTGPELTRWNKAIAPQHYGRGPYRDRADALASIARMARAGVSAETAQRFTAQQVPLRSFIELNEAGINDVEPWSRALHAQTQATAQWGDRVATGLHFIAEFAKVGGTPEQLRRAQRAGVPLAQSAAHVSSTPEQLWAAGAENRRDFERESARMSGSYGSLADAPQSWGVTRLQDL